MWVPLPATMKAAIWAGADVTESGLFPSAAHLYGGALTPQIPSSGKTGDSGLKARLLGRWVTRVSDAISRKMWDKYITAHPLNNQGLVSRSPFGKWGTHVSKVTSWEDGRLGTQSQSAGRWGILVTNSWKNVDSCHKAHVLEDGGLTSQILSPGKMGDSHLKAHLLDDGRLVSQSPSPFFRGAYREGEGNRTKRSRERVAEFSRCRQAQSILIRHVTVPCASSWFNHPGFPASWLHGWRSASLLELWCLRVEVCVFWS